MCHSLLENKESFNILNFDKQTESYPVLLYNNIDGGIKMKNIPLIIFGIFLGLSMVMGQENREQHISKLVLDKKKKESFHNDRRDSTLTLRIDTLILKDNASLQFYGLKDVKLIVNYAEIGKKAFISGISAKNNASNFDIEMNIQKLGSLFVVARGHDAMNGMRTDPNGDGGDVKFVYKKDGITPQTDNRKGKNYLYIDASAGGRAVNPQADIRIIMDRVASGIPRVGGLPQGQVYSGSAGREGKVTIEGL